MAINLTSADWEALIRSLATNIFIMSIVMTIGWYFCERIKNATFVDVIWSISFATLTSYFCFIGDAPLERKALLLLSILPWSLRLFFYLFKRSWQKLPEEDKRYATMRQSWGNKQHLMMLFVFQMQGLIIALLCLPMASIASNNTYDIQLNEIAGAFICILGWLGESLADSQLETFKSKLSNKNKTCNTGLWHYSRHPNYFFEWIVWVGIFIISIGPPFGILFIYCPLLMLCLLTQISGVKLSEEHSVKSRGDEYRLYQETTSSFIPWFKSAQK